MSRNKGKTSEVLSSLLCLHTLWNAIPTSFYTLKIFFFFFYVEMISMFTPNPTSFTFLKFLTSTQCQCYRAERVEGFNNCEAAARVCTSLKGPQPRKISLITRYHTKSGRDSSPLRLPTYLFPISNQKLDNGLETYYI